MRRSTRCCATGLQSRRRVSSALRRGLHGGAGLSISILWRLGRGGPVLLLSRQMIAGFDVRHLQQIGAHIYISSSSDPWQLVHEVR
jgi:hypothetical protein